MSSRAIVDDVTHNGLCNTLYDRPDNGSLDSREPTITSTSVCHGVQDGYGELSDSIIRGNMQVVNGQLKKIPRPLNAFMLFSNEKRKELKKEFPGEPNNMISSRLGAAWKALSDEKRKEYHDLAHREDLEHRRKYPNYQYCPGHARKLKKARREQRMRQQSSYRAARSCSGGADVATKGHKNGVKCGGNNMDDPITKAEANAPEQGIAADYQKLQAKAMLSVSQGGSGSCVPGPHGEAGYFFSPPFMSEHMEGCMQCVGCKSPGSYCCAEAHWNPEPLAGPYPPRMMYFSGPCDARITNDLMSQQYFVAGDFGACYPPSALLEPCFGPAAAAHIYPAGDGNADCKDFCFIPQEFLQPEPGAVPATAEFDATLSDTLPSSLTDISNSMVPPTSGDEMKPCLIDVKPCVEEISVTPQASPHTLPIADTQLGNICSTEGGITDVPA